MIFKAKKTIINNPDEMILQIAANRQERYGRQFAGADPETLAKALGHFDVKTACNVLMVLPTAQAAKVLGFLSQTRKDAIIERMPSQFAAELIGSVLKL
jgi:Mg/Co/Ni transporter MgtE